LPSQHVSPLSFSQEAFASFVATIRPRDGRYKPGATNRRRAVACDKFASSHGALRPIKADFRNLFLV
jgi:hypothetical protein